MFVLNTQFSLNRLYVQLLDLSCGVLHLMNLKKIPRKIFFPLPTCTVKTLWQKLRVDVALSRLCAPAKTQKLMIIMYLERKSFNCLPQKLCFGQFCLSSQTIDQKTVRLSSKCCFLFLSFLERWTGGWLYGFLTILFF